MELWPNPRRFLNDVAEYATPVTDLFRFTTIPLPFAVSIPLFIVSGPNPPRLVRSSLYQNNFMITIK